MAKLILESEHLIRAGPPGSSVTGIFYYFGSLLDGSMQQITAYSPMQLNFFAEVIFLRINLFL